MNEELQNEVLDYDWDIDESEIPFAEDTEKEYVEEVDTPVENENNSKEEATSDTKEKNESDETVESETKSEEFDFEITYNGEKMKLSKEEAITLAQKGKDYDRVRKAYDFIKELADDEGKSIEDFMTTTSDNLKDYKIKQLAEEKGISEEVAKELYESRVLKRKSLASEKEQTEKNEIEAKKNAEFQDFLNTYPNIQPNEIPQDVWTKVQNGTPLKYAYMEYELSNLKTENTQLKTNAKNKEQEITTGTQATSKPKDEFEEAWDNAD